MNVLVNYGQNVYKKGIINYLHYVVSLLVEIKPNCKHF